VRYQHSSGGIVTSSVYQQGDTFFVEVECHLPSSEVQVFAIEEFFASLLVYGRALVSPAFEPLGIELIHAAPPYAGEYLRLLGPQVRFGCLHNRMAIASHWLDMRLPNHNLPALR
ncbi:AraC family transcriptional regulator SphR, partial [Klebsiella pneumoniae]